MTAFLILLIAASSVTSCARRTKFNPFVVPYTPPGRMMQQGHIHSQVNPLHIQMQDFPSRPPGAGARAALRAAQEMDFASPFARHMREFQQLREDASNSPQLVLEERDMTMARSRSSISMTMARSRRSISLPFVDAPGYLDGVLPGDVGFDPLGFADETNLARMREAEIRHGRLAMVATWGWPTAEIGLRIAQALVPPASVCTGNGCAIDATTTGLKLETIALIGETYWTTLLLAAIVGELRARRLPVGVPAFDPLNLASRLSDNDDEAARLALAELKHGRLAMAAFAAYGIQKLSSGQLTFAHQLWGETCVNSLRVGGKAAGISTACFPQDLQKFDFVLSWEILYRVLTGYFSEPYF